jgi:hypothetical protein
MNALTLTLIRLAFLAVLWLFVIAAVGVVRTDMFGHALSSRQQRRQQKAQRARQPRPGRRCAPHDRGAPSCQVRMVWGLLRWPRCRQRKPVGSR